MLSPEWEKMLGGQQEIVNNIVLKEAKEILKLFSTKSLHGEILIYSNSDGEESRKILEISDYAEKIKNKNYDTFFQENNNPDEKWQLYSGGETGRSFFVSRGKDIKTTFDTLNWPSNYEVFTMPVGKNNHDKFYYFPTIWKYLKSSDLEKYLDNVKVFYKGNYSLL